MGHSIPILLQRDRFKFIVQVGNPSRLRGYLVSTAANGARRGYAQGTIVRDDLRRSNKQASTHVVIDSQDQYSSGIVHWTLDPDIANKMSWDSL